MKYHYSYRRFTHQVMGERQACGSGFGLSHQLGPSLGPSPIPFRVISSVASSVAKPFGVALLGSHPHGVTPHASGSPGVLRLETRSGGEFGWGGTSVTQERRCPKRSSV